MEMSLKTTSICSRSSAARAAVPLAAVRTRSTRSSWSSSQATSLRAGASSSTTRAVNAGGDVGDMGTTLGRFLESRGVLGYPEGHLHARSERRLDDEAELLAVDLPEPGVDIAEPDGVRA